MSRLSLDNGTYTDAEVSAALVANGRNVRFRFEHLDGNGNSQGYLNGVAPGATITYDSTSDIKRTANFTILEKMGDQINYLQDQIRPWMGVQMPDGGWAEYPLGQFLLSTSERSYQDGSLTRSVDGFDLTQRLIDSKVEKRYVVQKDTAYTDALWTLLGGYDSPYVTDSPSALAADRTWDPGTSKLQIITDLLTGVGYGGIWFDAFGNPICQPYVAPADGTSGWTYATNDDSVIYASQSGQSYDLFDVPNVFIRVITVTNKPLLSAQFTNSDPASPTSTVNRGRRIVDYQEANDASDQAALNALCRKAAAEAAQVYDTVTLTTALMPFHQNLDIVTVHHDGLGISGDYSETGWEMTLETGGEMTHTLSGVVSIDTVGEDIE